MIPMPSPVALVFVTSVSMVAGGAGGLLLVRWGWYDEY